MDSRFGRACGVQKASSMKKLALLFLMTTACATGRTAPATTTPPAGSSSSSTAQWDISNIANEQVDYWVSRFESDKRAEFASYLDRMKQYEPMITDKLRARQMPHDLIYLAMIESGFNPEAHSVANARGIW